MKVWNAYIKSKITYGSAVFWLKQCPYLSVKQVGIIYLKSLKKYLNVSEKIPTKRLFNYLSINSFAAESFYRFIQGYINWSNIRDCKL